MKNSLSRIIAFVCADSSDVHVGMFFSVLQVSYSSYEAASISALVAFVIFSNPVHVQLSLFMFGPLWSASSYVAFAVSFGR